MPWPTYSERFCGVQSGAGYSQYTVPAGMRAVLKAIVVSNGGATSGFAYVTVGGITVWILNFQASRSSLSVETMCVCYAGQALGCYASGSELSISCHGFLFADHAGRSAPPPAAEQKPAGQHPMYAPPPPE